MIGARSRAGIELVAIGCSTGGPEALATLLPALPADFPTPIVIVQHMSPSFTRRLAGRLDTLSALRVAEATTGSRPEPGLALIAPGDRHLLVEKVGPRLSVRTTHTPPVHSVRPSLDLLLQSVVESRVRCLVIVLTGMGVDGVEGCAAVRRAGGQVLVQDETTSIVWGMPGAVVREGLADRVLPLDELASQLRWRVGVTRPDPRSG